MNVKRAYKFRLYPNPQQQAGLARQFGATRFVYNYFLRQRMDYYANTGKGLTLSKGLWFCPVCQEWVDRDENAAQNILLWSTIGATETYAAGQNVSPTSVGGLGEGGSLSL